MKALRVLGKVLKALRYPALAIVLLFVGSILWIMYFVKDIPPVDDSDLRARPPLVSKEENAWPVLMKAAVPYKEVKEEKWNDVELAVSNYDQRVEAMDRAAKYPHSQGAFFKAPNERIPVVVSIRDLVRVRLLLIEDQWKRGERAQAQKDMKSVFEAARILEARDGGGFILSTLFAIAIRNLALEQLNRWAGEDGMTKEDMSGWIKYLVNQRVDTKGFQNVWRNEYLPETKVAAEYGKQLSEMKYLRSGDVNITGHEKFDEYLRRLAYRPERARKRLIAQYEEWIRNTTLPCSKTHFDLPTIGYPISFHSVKRLFQGEFGADIYHAVRTPNFLRIFSNKCTSDFLVESTRVRLAAKLFEEENGGIPPSLDALVPKYLDTVPTDSYDGKPLRYDSRRALIYSVGVNGKDDHAKGKLAFVEALKTRELYDQPDVVLRVK